MSNRLDRLLQAKNGGNQSEMARYVGVTPQAVQKWIAGVTEPRGKNLEMAADFLGVSQVFLRFGLHSAADVASGATDSAPAEYPAGLRPVTVSNDGDENPDLVKVKKVKIRVQAGLTGFQVETDKRDGGLTDVPRRWVEKNGFAAERLYSIEVHGESMEPSLYDGDTVVVNTADTKPVDGSVYVFNYEGEVVVKRLEKEGPMWYLASDNPRPEFRRRLIREKETFIIGRVVRKESERI